MNQFPNLSSLHQLTYLYFEEYSYPIHVIYNITDNKLPSNLEYVELVYCGIYQFPNLTNLFKLNQFVMMYVAMASETKNTSVISNLPSNLQLLSIEMSYSGILLVDTFPNFTNFSKLTKLEFSNVDTMEGIVRNISEKIPSQLQSLTLVNLLKLDKFPNLANFSQLKSVYFENVDVMNEESFVSTQLPPHLQNIWIYNINLKGTLNFRHLMSLRNNALDTNVNWNSSTSIVLYGIDFENVDFRGINDDTEVWLDIDVPCVVESQYPNVSETEIEE